MQSDPWRLSGRNLTAPEARPPSLRQRARAQTFELQELLSNRRFLAILDPRRKRRQIVEFESITDEVDAIAASMVASLDAQLRLLLYGRIDAEIFFRLIELSCDLVEEFPELYTA